MSLIQSLIHYIISYFPYKTICMIRTNSSFEGCCYKLVGSILMYLEVINFNNNSFLSHGKENKIKRSWLLKSLTK